MSEINGKIEANKKDGGIVEWSTILNIVLVGTLIGVAIYRFKPVKGLRNLSEQEMREKIESSKSISVIDVREPYEFNVKHIPGAINVPLSKLKWRKVDVPTDKEIVVYCQTGIRSKQAARLIMKRHKINELSQLSGGFFSWKGDTSNNRKA
jgi:rhodanese-related sulfurtransferase